MGYTEADRKRLFGDYKAFAAGGLDLSDIFGEELSKEMLGDGDGLPQKNAAVKRAASVKHMANGLASAYASAYTHRFAQLASSTQNSSSAPRVAARKRWEHVRHCQRVRHALAQTQWTAVLQAIQDNEAELQQANFELEARKAGLAALVAAADSAARVGSFRAW